MNTKQLLITFLAVITFYGCETSEGIKAGTLQKVSHKTFPCDYYEAEFAFEGGRQVGTGDNKSFENTQRLTIDKEAYDTLQDKVGLRVRFDYKDRGMMFCEESKILTTLTVLH
jgi:hypothetical protein